MAENATVYSYSFYLSNLGDHVKFFGAADIDYDDDQYYETYSEEENIDLLAEKEKDNINQIFDERDDGENDGDSIFGDIEGAGEFPIPYPSEISPQGENEDLMIFDIPDEEDLNNNNLQE